jgi:hypothetical protein
MNKFHVSPVQFYPGNNGIYVKNYIISYNTVTFYCIDTYKEH